MNESKSVLVSLIAVSMLFFAVTFLSFAQISSAQVNAPGAYTVHYTAQFSKEDLSFDQLKGYDFVRLMEGDYLSDIGKPMLPWKEIKIALPSGMAVKSVYVVDTKSEQITGEYNIFPAQPPLKIGLSENDVDFVQPDPQTYASLQPYPSQLVEFGYQADLAGQGMAVIQLYPMQYVPGEKKLTLYTSLTIEIAGVGGYQCGDYLSPNISETDRRNSEERVKEMVVNPQDVMLVTSSSLKGPSGVLPKLSFRHVIITSSSYASYFQTLADWHTQKGVRDTIITTSWIYANYPGTADSVKIRAFIRDADTTWGAKYFLLGGENETVPFCYRTYYNNENVPSDEYYADWDNDWVHEVFVGRVSVGTSNEIMTIISKILTYEKNPPRTDYPLDVLLVGMDLDASTPTSVLKEAIRSYIPARFNVHRVYDSYGGNHYDSTMYYLNAGQNLVNHSDHSNWNLMCTGDFHHGWCIYNDDVDALINYNQTSILVSIGCWPNAMDYNDCIAEHFVIYNPSQAGIAFNGNTRDGWYTGGVPISLSGILDREWWASLFNRNKYRLGETIADAKEHFSNGDAITKHCEWTFNLLGEPEMPIWTDSLDSFAVTCPESLLQGSKLSFSVHVEDPTTHVPVESAYVCLWKANEIYETGYTDVSGDVILHPLPRTTGTMYVTTTKHNYLPSEKQVVIPYICGEITEDGTIDLGDLVFLIAYIYRAGLAPNPMELADVNMDGVVNLGDVVFLISYLYKGGPAPCAD
jgi:hypothetical protein